MGPPTNGPVFLQYGLQQMGTQGFVQQLPAAGAGVPVTGAQPVYGYTYGFQYPLVPYMQQPQLGSTHAGGMMAGSGLRGVPSPGAVLSSQAPGQVPAAAAAAAEYQQNPSRATGGVPGMPLSNYYSQTQPSMVLLNPYVQAGATMSQGPSSLPQYVFGGQGEQPSWTQAVPVTSPAAPPQDENTHAQQSQPSEPPIGEDPLGPGAPGWQDG